MRSYRRGHEYYNKYCTELRQDLGSFARFIYEHEIAN